MAKRFFWRGHGKTSERRKFSRVFASPYLLEFRGSTQNTRQFEHCLHCSAIDSKIVEQLVDQHNQSIGNGRVPTHAIICVFKRVDSPTQPRVLFTCYLALAYLTGNIATGSQLLADAIAYKIALSLAKYLDGLERHWLIRCSKKEYPWCVDDADIDEYWAMQAAVFYRSVMRDILKEREG